MRYIIKRISKRSGINKEIFPIEVIQSLMGHEKSETTRIYAELSGQLRKEFYQKYF